MNGGPAAADPAHQVLHNANVRQVRNLRIALTLINVGIRGQVYDDLGSRTGKGRTRLPPVGQVHRHVSAGARTTDHIVRMVPQVGNESTPEKSSATRDEHSSHARLRLNIPASSSPDALS
jgi:hypothetical protein